MNLNLFMKSGIEGVLAAAGRFYLSNNTGRSFLAKALLRSRKSLQIRDRWEKEGVHIPPFLIASIASQCNLHCTGCYARAGGACSEDGGSEDLTEGEWKGIFSQAAELGIDFVLLAGGEPLLRRDVIKAAAETPELIFPIFTNGTLLDEDYIELFERRRSLIPIFSIEGTERDTDNRRGGGTYGRIAAAMEELKKRGILFGVSVTVTTENMDRVFRREFLSGLRTIGCGAAIFVEYVPAEKGTEHLAPDENDMRSIKRSVEELKAHIRDMAILSFPGDEEAMGGCLAAGRGFFHINARGGAEPCPFSPYSKHSLREHSLLQTLVSDYFGGLREIAAADGAHMGGCVLFRRSAEVEELTARP